MKCQCDENCEVSCHSRSCPQFYLREEILALKKERDTLLQKISIQNNGFETIADYNKRMQKKGVVLK